MIDHGFWHGCQNYAKWLSIQCTHSSNNYDCCKAHRQPTNSQTQRGNGWWRTKCISWCTRYERGFLQCQVLKASNLAIATMYSTMRGSITILICAYHTCGTKWPTHSPSWTVRQRKFFIDKQMVVMLELGTRTLAQPLNIHNIDGTLNQEGKITQYCDLWVWQGKLKAKLQFYVTILGQDWLILGYPWFWHFNPDIDWPTNSLKGDPVCIETAGYQTKKQQQTKTLRHCKSRPKDTSILPQACPSLWRAGFISLSPTTGWRSSHHP